MDRALLLLHLVAVGCLVREVGAAYAAGNNGHTAKKSPMDYSRYAQDARDISNRQQQAHGSAPAPAPAQAPASASGDGHSHSCDARYELRNATIIRTTDSMDAGAEFVGDTRALTATECRWLCCQNKAGRCDTAIYVEDLSKEKNCFLFACHAEEGGQNLCRFSGHRGYVSAAIGGFASSPTRPVASDGEDDNHNDSAGQQVKDDEDSAKDDNDGRISEDEDVVEGKAGSTKGAPEVEPAWCGHDQIQCASGECIASRYICNDIDDCEDGSDEMGCQYGAWRHWNDYNHRDQDPFRPDASDGYDELSNGPGDEDRGEEGGADSNQDAAGDARLDAHSEAQGDVGADQTEVKNHGADGAAIDDSLTPEKEEEEEDKEEKEEEQEGETDQTLATETPLAGPVVIPAGSKPSSEAGSDTSQPGSPDAELSAGEGQGTGAGQAPRPSAPRPSQEAEETEKETEKEKAKVEEKEEVTVEKVEPFGGRPATSAVLPLAMGLIITVLLLMMLSCRLRYMNRRLRYGRLKTHAHDADYLINGMYL